MSNLLGTDLTNPTPRNVPRSFPNMSEPTPRKRSRLACTSCQSRKRKCSGGQPCSTCAQTGSECQYSARKKRARSHSLYRACHSVNDRQMAGPMQFQILSTLHPALQYRPLLATQAVQRALPIPYRPILVPRLFASLGSKLTQRMHQDCNCSPGMSARDGYRQRYRRCFPRCLSRRFRRLSPKSSPRKRWGG
jgi:hypothetical protein